MMPKLKDTADNVLSSIGRNRSSLIEQVDRLQVVMETKRKIASGLFDEIDVNLDDVDLYSDVTSHTGILSQQSRYNFLFIWILIHTQFCKKEKYVLLSGGGSKVDRGETNAVKNITNRVD